MERDFADVLALDALAWLAGEEALLPAFLGSSGLTEADLRARAADPDVLAAVLDFILADDGQVISFSSAAGVAPERVAEARAALPGGMLPHWT